MINTLFLKFPDTVAVENTFVASFSTPNMRTWTQSRAILSNFVEEQWTQNYPQYLSALSRELYPTTFLETVVYIELQSGHKMLMCGIDHRPKTT